MLCCGLLTLLAAMAIGLWRRLRAVPRAMFASAAALLVAAPALAYSLTQPAAMTRADVIERAMHSLCGGG